jgi:hypothetical protein
VKKFLVRSIVFAFIVFFLLFANLAITRKIVRLSGSMKLPIKTTTLVLGDSHTECSLNDTIIQGIHNLSQSADFYIYSFAKLREMKKRNPHLKNVILGFSYDSITKHHDENIFSDKYINYKFGNYYYLMKISEACWLVKANPKAGIPQLFLSLKSTLSLIFSSVSKNSAISNLGIGEFQLLKRDKLKEHIERTKHINEIEVEKYSIIQKEYLKKIYSFCVQDSINLILFNSPLYDYKKLYHKNQIENLNKFYDENLSAAVYVNYEDFELPDSAYADCTHLNYRGSGIFSEYLNSSDSKFYEILK